MNTCIETNNQQPSILTQDEGSETIPKGSRETFPEAVSTLTDNSEGKDIVHTQKRFDAFVEKANKKFNFKFDYSKFVYINAKTKGIIVCPIHGEFLQNPDKHLNSEHACPECWKLLHIANMQLMDRSTASISKVRKRKARFMVESIKRYNNKFTYDLSNYKEYVHGKIKIICPKHGEFYSTPQAHMICATGCPSCGEEKKNKSKTKDYKNFLTEIHKVHGDKYKYPEIETYYKSRKTILNVICNVHGSFRISAQKHLSGRMCPKCNIDAAIKDNKWVGGYSEELFRLKPALKNLPAQIYYLSINDGEYYKIGITRTTIPFRIKGIRAKGKLFGYTMFTVDVLQTKSMTLYEAFRLEQQIIQSNLEFRKITKWSTELFSKDIKPFNIE